MDQIDTKLKTIFSEIFDISPNEINESSSKKEIPTWDSIRHLNLILEVESAFKVCFTPEQIITLQKYSDIRDAVKKYLSGN
jgi:acyl carrier protein